MDDPFDLERFVTAQDGVWSKALAEVRSGRKASHWMWFIFPQLEGLGRTDIARRYGLRSLDEARAYLDHPVLGARLTQISRAALDSGETSARRLMGTPDDLKLRSSMTLFLQADPTRGVFREVLDRFYDGERDPLTLNLLKA